LQIHLQKAIVMVALPNCPETNPVNHPAGKIVKAKTKSWLLVDNIQKGVKTARNQHLPRTDLMRNLTINATYVGWDLNSF